MVGVGTLLAMAEGRGAARVVCCLDARMGADLPRGLREERRALAARCTRPSLCAPGEAPLAAGRRAGPAAAAASRRTGEALEQRYAGRLSAIMPDVYPHARDIARLAVPEFEQGRAVAAEAAAPVYIRDKVALRSDER